MGRGPFPWNPIRIQSQLRSRAVVSPPGVLGRLPRGGDVCVVLSEERWENGDQGLLWRVVSGRNSVGAH